MTSPPVARAAAAPTADDIEPVHYENLHRTLTGLSTALPVLALGLAAWRSWEGLLSAGDLVVFASVGAGSGPGPSSTSMPSARSGIGGIAGERSCSQ